MIDKSKLIEVLTGKNRGLLASKNHQKEILAAIAQLEDYNPNPHPLETKELLNGNWRLIYTTNKLTEMSKVLVLVITNFYNL